MYLLDTNVLSELRKLSAGRADPAVTAWAQSVNIDALYLSVISITEIVSGYLAVQSTDPAQFLRLRHWFELEALPQFAGRILAIDEDVARRCATLQITSPRAAPDTLIAATALTHGLTVVTRNTRHFADAGVRLLNPWSTNP
jgi:predicted nucleic acid-binding protein